MTNQPTPQVSDADVERIARRDFAADRVEHVLTTLQEYGLEGWHCEPARVRLAVLKLSAGCEDHLRTHMQTTAETITGPLTGAISRGFQGCCLRFSLTVMAWCAPILLLGVLAQFLSASDRKPAGALLMTCWTVGGLVWFMGGVFSFAHALS